MLLLRLMSLSTTPRKDVLKLCLPVVEDPFDVMSDKPR